MAFTTYTGEQIVVSSENDVTGTKPEVTIDLQRLSDTSVSVEFTADGETQPFCSLVLNGKGTQIADVAMTNGIMELFQTMIDNSMFKTPA